MIRSLRVVCGILVFTLMTTLLFTWNTKTASFSDMCGARPETISEQAKEFIRQREGFRSTAYHDVKGYAIGYGMHTWQGEPVTRRYPGRVTLDDVEQEFADQLVWYGTIVSESVCAPLSQAAFDGLTSLAWNLGRINDAIITKVDAQQPVRAADFLTTAKIGRSRPKMLIERRLREYLMFAGQYDVALRPHLPIPVLQKQVKHLSVMLVAEPEAPIVDDAPIE